MAEQVDLSAARQKLLAQRLKGAAKPQSEVRKLPKRAPGGRVPLSVAQHQIWVVDQMKPGNPGYNVPVAQWLRGDLDLPELEDSFNTIIQRHEVLRTTFHESEGEVIQQIHEECRIQIDLTSCDHLPDDQRERDVGERVAQEAIKPFDLTALPLIRVSLYKVAQDEHVLLVNLHHIIGDGVSLNLLFDELDALYRAAISRTGPRLPELSVQYADFALWQREELSKPQYQDQLGYWQRKLKGDLPVLALSTDRPRTLRQSSNGSAVSFTIPQPLVQALTALGVRENCTFFATILAALQVILQRYSRTDEIIVGTPVTNRPFPEVDRLIGDFINLVVLRCDLAGNPLFTEVLRRSRELTLDALSNKDVPLEMVARDVKAHGHPNRNPVFQVLLQILPAGHAKIGGLAVGAFDFELRATQLDLALNLVEEPQGSYLGRLQFCTDLFAGETVERLTRNFLQLLDEIVRDPQRRVLEIPILALAEKKQLLLDWNETSSDDGAAMTLHALIDRQAERAPDSIAVEFEGQSLTFGVLVRRANQWANRLRSLGVEPNVLVSISLARSLDSVVGLLAILKAGGVCVPIDPEYPRELCSFLLDDAAAPVLLTHQKLVADLPPHSAKILCMDADGESVALESDCVPADGASSADLACVVYTSGSTGHPKGALHDHRGIANHLLAMRDRFQLTSSDAVLHQAPVSPDVAMWILLLPLVAGARLVVARSGADHDPDYLVRLIQQRRISLAHFGPSMLRAFLDRPGVSECLSLRHVMCSGEALPQPLQEKFFTRLACPLHNLYGRAETAFPATHWTCQRESSCAVAPLGRPVANTRCYIFDSLAQPVPIGVPGELHIGGAQVARGYHRRPELTDANFIADPFSEDSSARLHKTGDLCRYLPDGSIQYLGRIDQQVFNRGFRIELSEIEATLERHPSIRGAVVVEREDVVGDRRLVAYLAAAPTLPGLVAALRSHLKTHLPDYMIPSAFVLLEALPLTPHGRVDRRVLPAPSTQDDASSDGESSPLNLLELELIRIWRRLFQREDIDRHDNFFALGGHSLLAARLGAEINQLLGRKLPIAAVFQSPTVETMARRLGDENWAPPWSSLVPLQPHGSKPPIFFVHGINGDVYGFVELAKLLPADQPSYGIQAVGLDGQSERHVTIEDMAAYYVKEIISLQPEGPLYLLGFSLGGVITYEIAQQLHRLGRRVALLVLLDSPPFGKIPWRYFVLSWCTYICKRLLFHLGHLWRGARRGEWLEYLRGRWASLRHYVAQNRTQAPIFTAPPEKGIQPPEVPGYIDYYHAVACAYQLSQYPGTADIFVSEQFTHDWRWYWNYMIRGGVTFHWFPGEHLDFLLNPDYTPLLAKSLTAVLERAQQKEQAIPRSDVPASSVG